MIVHKKPWRVPKYLIIFLCFIFAVCFYCFFQKQKPVTEKNLTLPQTPSATSTQTDRQSYFDLVSKDAVPTDTVDVSSCVLKPLISSMKKGSTLVFVNKDNISHKIVFSPNMSFIIGTSSSGVIKADFGKFPGIYPFTCYGPATTTGIVILKP